MKIMAPAYSCESARVQITAGADELYLGLASSKTKYFGFSGRSRFCELSSEEELRKTVALAHDQGVEVNFTANALTLPVKFEKQYVELVKKAIAADVDAIIVGCLPALLLLRELNVDAPLYASNYFNTFNTNEIRFLESLGISRIILPYDVILPEIQEFCSSTNLEIEVFGIFGCSNINGRCLLFHATTETIDVGSPCRGKYTILEPREYKGKISPVLDGALECSLCSLPELMNANVAALKLLDRCLHYKFVSQFTRVLKKSVNALQDGATIEDIKRIAFKEVPWWPHYFCEERRCKYRMDAAKNFGYII